MLLLIFDVEIQCTNMKKCFAMKKYKSIVMVLFVLFCSSQLQADDEGGRAGALGGEGRVCTVCHQSDPVKQVFLTKHVSEHGSGTLAVNEQCETCHGPSASHSKSPVHVKSFRFGVNSDNNAADQNAVCLGCHKNEPLDNWHGSLHKQGELSCSNCHTIHREEDPVFDDVKATSACLNCHKDKSMSQHVKGLHVIESGKVGCIDCHNPHAKLDTSLCVSCHRQDQRTLARQSDKAQSFHTTAAENNLSCLKCHNGVAHGVPAWVEDMKQQLKKQP